MGKDVLQMLGSGSEIEKGLIKFASKEVAGKLSPLKYSLAILRPRATALKVSSWKVIAASSARL
jgi:hypothetical protein